MKPALIKALDTLFENVLHFRVTLPANEAKSVLSEMDKCNSVPANIGNIIDRISEAVKVSDVGEVRFSVGREYSLVIYVQAVRAIDVDEAEKLLTAISRKFNASEFTFNLAFEGSFTARLWWD